jgi:DNA modification methylase
VRKTNIGEATLVEGDVLAVLRSLPDESINCCVTSPPYWGLRDYGIDPQIWDDPTAGKCAHEWGEESYKVKEHDRPDHSGNKLLPTRGMQPTSKAAAFEIGTGSFCGLCGAWRGSLGLEPTTGLYIVHMVAVFEEVRRCLRKDGTCWVNMGDSYASAGGPGWQGKHGARGKRSHTQRRLIKNTVVAAGIKAKDIVGIPWMVAFALRAAGWWLRQDIIWSKPNPLPESVTDRCTKAHEYVFLLTKSPRYYFNQNAITEECSENTHLRISQDLARQVASYRANGGGKTNGPMKAVVRGSTAKIGKREDGTKWNKSFRESVVLQPVKRNKRSVWEIPSMPFSEAHFATFPEKLVEPCILSGCPPDGVVLDPFLGSGTTGIVAIRLGRKFVGIELKPEYVAMAGRRIRTAWKNRASLFLAAELEPAPELLQGELR